MRDLRDALDRSGEGKERRSSGLTGSMSGSVGDELDGVVVELLPRALYRVEVGPGDSILAHASREAHRNFVRILKGDRVRVLRAARDRTRGRITTRLGPRP